eukprot:2146328-Rhodomonas_salina.1
MTKCYGMVQSQDSGILQRRAAECELFSPREIAPSVQNGQPLPSSPLAVQQNLQLYPWVQQRSIGMPLRDPHSQ